MIKKVLIMNNDEQKRNDSSGICKNVQIERVNYLLIDNHWEFL